MATLILRRQKHAHRQFLAAIHTLALVRRLKPRVIASRAMGAHCDAMSKAGRKVESANQNTAQ
jgi:hypothetical protein